jgi:hypothetical protein
MRSIKFEQLKRPAPNPVPSVTPTVAVAQAPRPVATPPVAK